MVGRLITGQAKGLEADFAFCLFLCNPTRDILGNPDRPRRLLRKNRKVYAFQRRRQPGASLAQEGRAHNVRNLTGLTALGDVQAGWRVPFMTPNGVGLLWMILHKHW